MNLYSLSAATFVLLIAICHPARAQEVVAPGTMTDVSPEIGRLIHLKWQDDRLAIDRDHWEVETEQKTEEEKEKEQLEAMIKRGIPRAIAEKMMKDRGGPERRFMARDFLTASPEGELFQELKAAAGAMSGGGGGGGEEMHWDGHGEDVYLSMHRSKNSGFRFMIRESIEPYQEFLIEEHNVKGLRLQFTGPTRQLIFSHANDGSVRVAHTSEKRNDAVKAASYEELLRTHPEFISEFTSMLEQLGVNRPFTDRDPRIVKAATAMLLKPDPPSLERAKQMVAKLDAGTYQVREAAHKEIAENFVAWRSFVLEQLKNGNLTKETRSRLNSIQIAHGGSKKAEEKYIQRRGLIDDAEYLTSVLPDVPDVAKRFVESRIAELKSKPNK